LSCIRIPFLFFFKLFMVNLWSIFLFFLGCIAKYYLVLFCNTGINYFSIPRSNIPPEMRFRCGFASMFQPAQILQTFSIQNRISFPLVYSLSIFKTLCVRNAVQVREKCSQSIFSLGINCK
jgi:hypothetical protein